MPNTTTIHVTHLGGIDAAYQMPKPYDASKPTIILVNSFTTSSELYRKQYANDELTSRVNLVAIELLGHGQTRTESEHFTYWDTAIMNLQIMEALGINKAFVLGTSPGGWICVRMALLAPERVSRRANSQRPATGCRPNVPSLTILSVQQIIGIIPLGTSIDYESPRTRELGCWDGVAACTGPIDEWSTHTSTADFEPSNDYCDFLIDVGFGKSCDADTREFWHKTIKSNYHGDDGRRRARMAAINLRDRDGLHGRVVDVKCPVLWMHVSPLFHQLQETTFQLTYISRAQTTKSTASRTPRKKSSSSRAQRRRIYESWKKAHTSSVLRTRIKLTAPFLNLSRNGHRQRRALNGRLRESERRRVVPFPRKTTYVLI
jgi:pimeloyl-ACP methyl ester carboxylesterase